MKGFKNKIFRNNMAYKKKGGVGKKVGFGKKFARSGKKYIGVGKQRTLNVGGMLTDAKKLVSLANMLNAEKKILSIGAGNILATGQIVGQVNQNITGATAYDITPMMPQGSGVSDRTGNSVKLHSAYYQFQVQQQSASVQTPLNIRIEMWSNPGITQDPADLLGRLYVPNVFTGIIDYNSARNPDHYNDYRCIMRKTVHLPVDSLAGQLMTKQFAVPFKFNRGKGHHIRYTGSGYTNPLTDVKAGQFFMVYFCSVGNLNPTLVSTLNVPVTAVSTGAQIKFSSRTFYYDN
jgi:hypothetical protein